MARSPVNHLVNRYARRMRMALERRALASKKMRSVVNRFHNTMSDAGRHALWARSAKIFRDHPASFGLDVWEIDVGSFQLKMPLRGDHAWLDWDMALSAMAHDREVKDFYAKILNSRFRPDVFCDIGANYGIHTALFLSAGVRSVAFEPNPSCLSYFKLLMELNDFKDVNWEPVALSDANGEATLAFPERETWLGSIRFDNDIYAVPHENITEQTVPVRRLDDITIEGKRCFAKLDTEGLEVRVIRGGRTFFRDRCRFFIFESNHPVARNEIFDEIASLGFSIELLPIDDIEKPAALSLDAFIETNGTNFLARRGLSERFV